MGCDGGTIPKRDELVKTQKKPEQVDKDAETAAKWKYCAISQEELKSPIVSCELGKLYNKDAVIEYLLDKSSGNETVKHIRSLKDVMELKLSPNPNYQKDQVNKGDEYVDRCSSEFICPITGLEMNGKYRFCYIRKCGCVLSERSLKEIKADVCHRCGEKYEEKDVIVLNGTEADIKVLKLRMEERRLHSKLEKKSRKDLKQPKTEEIESPMATKKIKLETAPSTSKQINGKTDRQVSSSCTKDLNIQSMLKSETKVKQSYKVSKDPNATEAFKSLFTSHQSCKNQPRAHWVTYNPLYN